MANSIAGFNPFKSASTKLSGNNGSPGIQTVYSSRPKTAEEMAHERTMQQDRFDYKTTKRDQNAKNDRLAAAQRNLHNNSLLRTQGQLDMNRAQHEARTNRISAMDSQNHSLQMQANQHAQERWVADQSVQANLAQFNALSQVGPGVNATFGPQGGSFSLSHAPQQGPSAPAPEPKQAPAQKAVQATDEKPNNAPKPPRTRKDGLPVKERATKANPQGSLF